MTEIRMENMSFSYGNCNVFSNISLKIEGSNLVCILGPNGVGKTTLVKCINKLLKPTSGHIYINDNDVQDMHLLDLAQIMAYVPNSAFSVFSMTVAEAILMGRHPHAGWTTSENDMDVVDKAIDTMDLQDLSERDIRELSAGQLQRVMIARGLAQEPEILILDEPTSNLDVKHQMEVMRFLKRYAVESDTTILMVCHDLNITAAFADRIIIMSNGGIFADGKAEDVLTEDCIKQVYDVDVKVIDVEGRPHVILLPGIKEEKT
ncbi:MAG: ABC transporter ATP-binding protein [Candidatus Cloacimonetes bacterium]|nr:ABC transporter ATP-binding protein [Candidatus Cloacimonadota bacterium]